MEKHRSGIGRRNGTLSEGQQLDINGPDLGLENLRIESFLATHSGPLPPASEFAEYESAFPGAADRILKMAEESITLQRAQIDAEFRTQDVIARSVDSSSKLALRQQSIFAAISILILVGSFVLAWYEKSIPFFFGLALAAVSGYLAYKTGQEKRSIYPVGSDQS